MPTGVEGTLIAPISLGGDQQDVRCLQDTKGKLAWKEDASKAGDV